MKDCEDSDLSPFGSNAGWPRRARLLSLKGIEPRHPRHLSIPNGPPMELQQVQRRNTSGTLIHPGLKPATGNERVREDGGPVLPATVHDVWWVGSEALCHQSRRQRTAPELGRRLNTRGVPAFEQRHIYVLVFATADDVSKAALDGRWSSISEPCYQSPETVTIL